LKGVINTPNSLKMQFKTKLLEFIDELLVLFEDKNKIVYRRLIHYHHQVKNRLDEDDLYAMAIDFLSQEMRGMIANHNHSIMKGTPLEMDVNLLWESCTSKNKVIIWKWVEVIVETLEPCLV
jgi:hypothetical protein